MISIIAAAATCWSVKLVIEGSTSIPRWGTLLDRIDLNGYRKPRTCGAGNDIIDGNQGTNTLDGGAGDNCANGTGTRCE